MNTSRRNKLNAGYCPARSGEKYTSTAIQAQVKVLVCKDDLTLSRNGFGRLRKEAQISKNAPEFLGRGQAASILQQAGRTPPCVPETFLPSSFSPHHCKDSKSEEKQAERGRIIFGV